MSMNICFPESIFIDAVLWLTSGHVEPPQSWSLPLSLWGGVTVWSVPREWPTRDDLGLCIRCCGELYALPSGSEVLALRDAGHHSSIWFVCEKGKSVLPSENPEQRARPTPATATATATAISSTPTFRTGVKKKSRRHLHRLDFLLLPGNFQSYLGVAAGGPHGTALLSLLGTALSRHCRY